MKPKTKWKNHRINRVSCALAFAALALTPGAAQLRAEAIGGSMSIDIAGGSLVNNYVVFQVALQVWIPDRKHLYQSSYRWEDLQTVLLSSSTSRRAPAIRRAVLR